MRKLGWRFLLAGLAATAVGSDLGAAERPRPTPAAEASYFADADSFEEPATVRAAEVRTAGLKSSSVQPIEARTAGMLASRRNSGGEEPVEMVCDEMLSCESPWWAHRSGLFGELLYLRPGSTDVIYAIEQNDVTANAFPTGPTGDVSIQGALGFRVGFNVCMSECSSLVASYSYWYGEDFQQMTRTGSNVLESQIIHPSTATTGASSLQASGAYDMSFNVADLAHRSLIVGDETFALNWSAGLRYGNLSQKFQHRQTVSTATGLVTVNTDTDFDGFGLMFGLDGMMYSERTGIYSYSRALISMLGGEWKSSYRQTNQFGGGVVGNDYEDFRITPQGELEVGLGWQNCSGCLKLSVGYLVTGWFDAVSTRSYVDAVRAADYTNLGETITFNGLVTRVEFAF